MSFAARRLLLMGSMSQQSDVDAHILIGQSNMKGNLSDVANLPSGYTGSKTNVKIWNDTQFESLNSSTNNNQFPASTRDNAFGPEFTYLLDQATLRATNQYCIKYAVGATGLYPGSSTPDWSPGSVGGLYSSMVSAITNANNWARAHGLKLRFKSIFWMQGERDATNATYANAYQTNIDAFFFDNLIPFLQTLDNQVNETTIPILLPRIHNGLALGTYPARDTVRTAEEAFAVANSNVKIIDTDFYPRNADNVHYSDLGYLWLGQNALAKLNGNFVYNEQWTASNPAGITVTNPVDSITVTNGAPALVFAPSHASIINLFVNKAETGFVLNTSGTVAISALMTWSSTTTPVSGHILSLYKDASNYARIGARNTSDGSKFRILIVIGTVQVYNLETSYAQNALVKITFDYATTRVRFWVLPKTSTTNLWEEIDSATVKTYDVAGAGQLKALFSTGDNLSDSGGASCSYRSLFMANSDFTAAFPI